jgi:hypothetical protein
MGKILILVEGQTEEKFVKEILAPHLVNYDVNIIPTIITTKRIKAGPDFKGGIISYAKVRNDLRRLLGDTSADCVTTMIDLYGLPDDFPGLFVGSDEPYSKVQTIEQAFEQDVAHDRFSSHLTLHEFEGLLFTKPSEISRTLNKPEMRNKLEQIRNEFNTPEEINDNPQTAPSKRIEEQFPEYRKTFHGSVISKRIGLEAIRAECPHFGEWVAHLETFR